MRRNYSPGKRSPSGCPGAGGAGTRRGGGAAGREGGRGSARGRCSGAAGGRARGGMLPRVPGEGKKGKTNPQNETWTLIVKENNAYYYKRLEGKTWVSLGYYMH